MVWKKSNGWFETAYKDNDSIWVVPAHSYYFYRYDVLMGTNDEPICFPLEVIRENKTGERAFGSLQKVGDKIFFIPAQTRFFLIYDIKTGRFEEIDMGTNMPQFYKSIVFESRLYMFSVCYPGICCYDIAQKKIINWGNICDKIGEDISFTPYVTFYQGKVYIPSNNTNALLINDLSTGETQVLKYGSRRHGLPCCVGEKIYTISDNGKNLEIEVYDLKDGACELIQIPDYPSEWVNETTFIPFLIAKRIGNQIYYFPKNSGGYIIRLNIDTEEVFVIKKSEIFDSFSNVITGDVLDEYIYEFKTDQLVNLNDLSEVIEMNTEKAYSDYRKIIYLTDIKGLNRMVTEVDNKSLKDFLEVLDD